MKRRYDYLGMKYTPNRQNLSASGQRSKHAFIHRIAYTETMRGIRDDIPTLLFYAPLALCKDAAQYIYDILKNHVEDIRVVPSHSCRVKNGKCYWRTEVQVIGLNTELLNFESFTRMLIHRMQVVCNCKIRHLKLDTFLNT